MQVQAISLYIGIAHHNCLNLSSLVDQQKKVHEKLKQKLSIYFSQCENDSLVPRPSLTAFFAAVREGLGTRL